MSKYASITLSFDHFHFHPTAQLVPDLILTLCQTKIAERESFCHSDFCLLESLIYLPISLSLLETGQRNSRFLFLLSKLGKGILVSLSPLETGQEHSRFLFLLSRWGKEIQISLSLLEIGEREFRFLFLLSNAEKLFSSFSFSSRSGFFASRQWLVIVTFLYHIWVSFFTYMCLRPSCTV